MAIHAHSTTAPAVQRGLLPAATTRAAPAHVPGAMPPLIDQPELAVPHGGAGADYPVLSRVVLSTIGKSDSETSLPEFEEQTGLALHGEAPILSPEFGNNLDPVGRGDIPTTDLARVPFSAPLPSLSAALSRRRAIFGAVALTTAPVAVLPALARGLTVADPFPAYNRELLLIDSRLAEEQSDEACEPLFARFREIDSAVIAGRPSTMPGALAALEIARREYVQHEMMGDEAEDDHGHQIILSLLDGALGVVRQAVQGGARV